jgi:hypothetical protein
MKKLILSVLMVVMVATPCLAQEVEPAGIFSIRGTVWQAVTSNLILPITDTNSSPDRALSFYNGRVYNNIDGLITPAFYLNMLGVSVYFIGYAQFPILYATEIGIMFPAVGEGMSMMFGLTHGILPVLEITQFNKTADDWTPPGE